MPIEPERSPKLRPDRPFRIRREPWFGTNYLNGPAWVITVRRGDHFLTCRLGGWETDLSEAVEYIREARAQGPC